MPVPLFSRSAVAAAVFVTTVELAALFIVLSPRHRVMERGDTPVVVERVVFAVPSPSRARGVEQRVPALPSPPTHAPSGGPVATRVMPRDSIAADAPSTRSSSPPSPASSSGAAVSNGVAAGPVLAPRGFNSSAPLTRHIIDSVLDSLNARMPALIWARVPTQAERDAAYKESALAMRLSGRALLVPADPHLAPGIRLPSFFSRQKQREAARVRSDSVLAENMARLAWLRARAQRDSIRRDSLRRADSLANATLRRPPGARTPT